MKILIFITLSLLIEFSVQVKTYEFKREDPIAKQADVKIAIPWGLNHSKVKMKEETVLLISLYGNHLDGKQWRLMNEQEIKEKWGLEPLNLDEQKSGTYVFMDNASGSRKMKFKGTWKFLIKAGKIPANGEPAIIKVAYGTSFEEIERSIDLSVVVLPKDE
jgi:hypothetical protein